MSRASIKSFLTLVAVTSAMTSTAALASEAKRAPAGYSADGGAIETVFMPHRDRITLCLSSQIGCGLACPPETVPV